MNYVTQLNAFCEKAVGVLDAKEQAMYLRLFYIANRLKWPEWFSVANSQLMRELKAGKNVVISLKRSLQKKGFIEVLDPGHKKATMYHLVPLVEIPKGSKNKPIDTKGSEIEPINSAKGSEIEHHGFQNRTSRVSKRDTSININNKHIAAAAKEESQASKVFEIFQNNIHPISGEIEKDTLDDLIKDYGPKWVEEAIKEAALNNGRSVKYISVILERWSRDGFKAERRKTNGTNERNHARRAVTVPANGWADAERRAEAWDGWPED